MKYYIHNVPGRLRLRLPIVKNNEKGLQALEVVIGKLDGVKIEKVNPLTGSVVLTYDKVSKKHEDILNALRDADMVDTSMLINDNQYIKNAILNTGNSINKTIANMLIGNALESTPLSFISMLI
ncbi:MAG: heavy-metal-associated domain-containing protein [Candidatus Magnetoovum sp. WYHC-5]|nr:heavy-metal-associated domain-containing protein [Candidatus Magnetoovum sp. WYHC-5]